MPDESRAGSVFGQFWSVLSSFLFFWSDRLVRLTRTEGGGEGGGEGGEETRFGGRPPTNAPRKKIRRSGGGPHSDVLHCQNGL